MRETHPIGARLLLALSIASMMLVFAPEARAQQNATCGLPGHEADCRRILRLYEVAVASVSMGTCEGMTIAARTCGDALQIFEQVRVALPEANQMQGARPEAMFNSPAPLRMSVGLERAWRTCRALTTASAPAPETQASRSIDEDFVAASDGMAPIRTAIGHFTVGLALQAAAAIHDRCPASAPAARAIIATPAVTPQEQSSVERFIAARMSGGGQGGGMLRRPTPQRPPSDTAVAPSASSTSPETTAARPEVLHATR